MEFDFNPGDATQVYFNFVFGTDEYPDSPSYNDGFAILVNGTNVALTPGNQSPVEISNFDTDVNRSYYKEASVVAQQDGNEDGFSTQDITAQIQSMSVPIQAVATVVPNEVNHIKFAIADAGDDQVDSFVFVQGGSLSTTPTPVGVTLPTVTAPVLASVSDSGLTGDDLTNIALPTLTGTATDGSTVSLYDGGLLIGTGTADATTGAWSVTATTPLNEGSNSLTATATDADGNVSLASPALSVTLDTTSPEVTSTPVLADASDSGIKGDSLTNVASPTLTGTAEPGSAINLYDGQTLIGTGTADATTGAWSITAATPLNQGANSLTATATDVSGNVSPLSAALTVTLDTTPPVATSIPSLATGSDSGAQGDGLTNVAVPVLTGTAEPGSTINLYDGQTLIGTGTSDHKTGVWSITAAMPLNVGINSLTTTATDASGNVSPVSTPLSVTLDVTPPVVSLALAKDTGTSATDNITQSSVINGTVDGPGTIAVSLNGKLIESYATAGGPQLIAPPGLVDGTYQVTLSDTDAAGNVGTTSLAFTLDTSAPTITVALADDTGISTTDGITNNPTLAGTAEAGSTVTVLQGASVLGSTMAAADGSWSFAPAGLADGNHILTASQTDAAGNTGTSSISFTLNTVVPAITAALANDTGTSAVDGLTTNDTLTGTATAGGTVTILNGTTVLGTTAAGPDGSWSFTPKGLADGSYILTASQTSIAGNTNTASVGLTLDTTAPVLGAALAQDTGASATDGITADPKVIGTTDGAGKIVFSLNGQIIESYASPGGQQVISPADLPDGAYQVTLSDTDAAGNTGTATLDFTLDTKPPVLTAALAHDSGAQGSDGITNNPALTGTAEAGGTVTILNGATVLGTTTAGPAGSWAFTPTGLADGSYTLTTSQTDAAGNAGSATVGFTLSSAVPTVTAALADDTGVSAIDGITDNDAVTGTAAAGTTVTIAEGDTVLGTATAGNDGSWNFTPLGLAEGSHVLTVSQTDIAGNTGTTDVGFTLIATAPTVTAEVAQDSGPSATDGITNTSVLTGTATPGGTVTVLNGTTVLGTSVVAADGSWSFTPSGLKDGTYSLTASQTDLAGNTGSATTGFTLDTTAPVVTLALAQDTGSPADIGITQNPAMTATVDGPGIVTVTLNGQVIDSYASTGGQQIITPHGLPDGTYQAAISETDAAGNGGTAALTFTLDTAAPTIVAVLANDTGPSATDGITNDDTLTGTAEAGGTVTILNDGIVLGTTTAGSDGSWTFVPTGFADGRYALTASQTDAAGNIGTTLIDFTLDSAVPTVTAVLASDPGSTAGSGITQSGTLTGTAEAGGSVTILNGSTVLGTTRAASDGSWSFTPTASELADGSYTLTASQTDAAGNIGTASVSVTLDRVYTSDLDNDASSSIFVVLDKPGRTANIDLIANNQPVTVYGGGAAMNLTAAQAVVVMNGPGQTSATAIHSLGNTTIWAGQSTINVDGSGGNHVILTGGAGLSGTVNLTTTAGTPNEVDVWGAAGTTQAVNNEGIGQTVVFGGRSDLDFNGGNATIVLNGNDQSGSATIDSTGGNTVWAGTSSLGFTEGVSGNDTVVLTGKSGTLIHGVSTGATGTTRVVDAGGTGQFEYDGGGKTANISIGAEQATVFGGSAQQTLALNGSGSLLVASTSSATGLQDITVGQTATGSLAFWGGGNDADITLGAGAAFIKAGTGNTTLTGGAGSLSLDLTQSTHTALSIDGSLSGNVNIVGYTPSTASVNVTDVDSQAVIGGSLVMHLHDGSTITYQSYVPSYTTTTLS